MMSENNPAPAPLSVLIADDHTLILEIIGLVLENSPDIKLSTAVSIDGAIEQLKKNGEFDLILLDLDMPGMHGVETLKQITALNAGKPVGIITGGPTPRVVDEMTRNGAAGLVPKTTSMKSLTNAIRFMAAGERYFPLELIQENKATQKAFVSPLSDREVSVLNLLADGMPNREIGENLGLAEATVKMHVKSICRKLGVTNRTQAVIQARNLKLA
ncbi:response regulator transcription factor [Pseudomonas sp. GX19020]|uniref:response regulator transcription factor n=2 Tax=Pseudomonadota TaxID=1224 RepID=UPI00089B2BA4|nr:response regulator transcription factor [Pseudomonas sp. GX19020]MCL4067132.1 response regulator transcription factor [Pseudomonas sp. GX19020]SED31206.1 two component transcriptional regulator, LuxR family [Rhodobacter sp. 24-YEA-8]